MHGLWSFVLLTACVVQGLTLAQEMDWVRIPLPPAKTTMRLNKLHQLVRGPQFQ